MSTSRSPLSMLRTAAHRRKRGLPVWRWFDHRYPTKRTGLGLPVGRLLESGPASAALEHRLDEARANRRRRIFLNMPMCCHRCSGCAKVGQPMSAQQQWYVHAVTAQTRRMSHTAWAIGGPVEAICIGGGVTRLPANVAAETLQQIRRSFLVTDDCEVTIESSLPILDAGYLAALTGAGANHLRLSVGILDDPLRRYHRLPGDRSEMLMAIDLAKSAGLTVSADLSYNLPMQPLGHWPQNIETLVAVGVDAITVDPTMSGAHREDAAQDMSVPVSIRREYQFAQIAEEYFDARDEWDRASPVHYARDGAITHRYRTHHDGSVDVLGIGLAVSGQINGLVYANAATFEQYLNGQSDGFDRHLFAVIADPRFQAAASWYRLVETGAVKEPLGQPGTDSLRLALDLFEEAGLIEIGSETRLTPPGRFWSWNIAAIIRRLITDGILERFTLQIQEQRDMGYRDHMEQIRIHVLRIADQSTSPPFDVLTVMVEASAVLLLVSSSSMSCSRYSTPTMTLSVAMKSAPIP